MTLPILWMAASSVRQRFLPATRVVAGNTGNSGGAANTIFINIDPGQSTANQVIAAVQASAAITAQFDVALDDADTAMPPSAGDGAVDVQATAVTAACAGQDADLSAGLKIMQGPADLQRSADRRRHGGGFVERDQWLRCAAVLAEINADGTGVEIRSRLAGADFSIGENGGQTATQLGVRTFTGATALAELNARRGVETAAGADLTIVRSDGTQLAIDLDGATSVQDVLI